MASFLPRRQAFRGHSLLRTSEVGHGMDIDSTAFLPELLVLFSMTYSSTPRDPLNRARYFSLEEFDDAADARHHHLCLLGSLLLEELVALQR